MKKITFAIFFLIYTVTVFAQKVIILHTNDHHGYFMTNNEGHYGLAAQATLVKQIREEARLSGAEVIILSAGDVNTGAPESRFFNGTPDIEAMNKIGYDAMTIGNHEFDIPTETLKEQQKLAQFPFLSSNIKDKKGKNAFTPYITKEVVGKKIAIVGFTTHETPNMSPPNNRVGLKFEPPDRSLVKKLRKDHDLVIALSHMGYYPDELPDRKFFGDIGLARKIPEIDLIIGGHTHSEILVPVKIGNTSIVQAKDSGQRLGRIDIDLSGRSPVISNYQLLHVKDVPQDPEVKKIVESYLESSREKFQRKVGYSHSDFAGGRKILSTAGNPLGNFLAEAQRTVMNADVAVVNGRGLRKGLGKGDITFRDLVSVSPFGNTMTTAELNGQEIHRLFQTVHEMYIIPSTENAYFSQGLELMIEDGKLEQIFINGKKVPNSAKGKYRFTTANYITEMVEEFSFIKNHPTYINSGLSDVEALEQYLKKNPEIKAEMFSHQNLKSSKHPCSQSLLNLLRSLQVKTK